MSRNSDERPRASSSEALSSSSVVSPLREWQPIETAPKDGKFLVYDGVRIMVMDGKILAVGCSPGVPQHLSAHHWTHWMPLPDPPALFTPGITAGETEQAPR